jgi:SAM-dependent methyltransferase
MKELMTKERLESLCDYIRKFQAHLDNRVGRYTNPQGKRVLVIGSGWGTEIYWALTKGATYVVGLDPALRDSAPLAAALSAKDEALCSKFEILQATTDTAPPTIGKFDVAISNNVFEHISDLSKALSATRRFLPDKGARIVIFADPLFYSSHGSHLPIGPWEHLTERQQTLKDRIPAHVWTEYRNGLNGMTLTTFLEAVREAGLIIEHMYTVADRALPQFRAIQQHLPPGLKPMDLCLEGVGCLLAFPENI